LRIARNLLLMVLVVLLLPYLLALLYRAGHPVSTLMAWRYLTGAPMSRQWIDLNAMSPALPRSVVASEDAKFCRHHGIDWDALREVIDDAEDGEVARGGSTITQQVAKNLFLWPGRSGAGASAGAVDRSGPAEAADPGNLSEHRRAWPVRPVRRAKRGQLCLRPSGLKPVAARGGAFGGDPAQSYQAERAQSWPRRAPPGRDLCGPGAGVGIAALLERKSRFLRYFQPSFGPFHPL
jgi:hypothetical protein